MYKLDFSKQKVSIQFTVISLIRAIKALCVSYEFKI